MVVQINKNTSKEELNALLNKMDSEKPKQKGFDAEKFCGILKLDEDPLDIQRLLRDEWD